MKTDRNLVEGQLDIFEAMDRAAAAVDRMTKETKNGKEKKAPKRRMAVESKDKMRGCDMHASMQKTFLNPGDGDFATVAYIDYHMVYFRDWNSPASLKRFENSKDAVEYYMKQLNKIRQLQGAEETGEHEPFLDVEAVAENEYAECI